MGIWVLMIGFWFCCVCCWLSPLVFLGIRLVRIMVWIVLFVVSVSVMVLKSIGICLRSLRLLRVFVILLVIVRLRRSIIVLLGFIGELLGS